MADNKIKIHGGRLKTDEDQSGKSVSGMDKEAPVRTHAPGETFHPDGSQPAEDSEKPKETPTADATAPSADIKPPQPEPPSPAPVKPHSPESLGPFEQPEKDEPLKIHKEPSSFTAGLLKTLLWLLISIVVLIGLGLAAIYFFKI